VPQKPSGESNAEKEKKEAEQDRTDKLLEAGLANAPPAVANVLKKIAPCIKATIEFGKVAWPYICTSVSYVHWAYN
jgi:hypothetical protein